MEGADGFIVTSQMIYGQLLQIQMDVNLVKERLDNLSSDRQDHENRLRLLESEKVGAAVEDHESRLRSVERRILLTAGASGGVVAGLIQIAQIFYK
jgi:transposase